MPFRPSRKSDPVDPVERAIADLQVATGVEVTIGYSRRRKQWEARCGDRSWSMGSRSQLSMEILEHLSHLHHGRGNEESAETPTVDPSEHQPLEAIAPNPDDSTEDLSLDLTGDRPADLGEDLTEDLTLDLDADLSLDRLAALTEPVEESSE